MIIVYLLVSHDFFLYLKYIDQLELHLWLYLQCGSLHVYHVLVKTIIKCKKKKETSQTFKAFKCCCSTRFAQCEGFGPYRICLCAHISGAKCIVNDHGNLKLYTSRKLMAQMFIKQGADRETCIKPICPSLSSEITSICTVWY